MTDAPSEKRDPSQDSSRTVTKQTARRPQDRVWPKITSLLATLVSPVTALLIGIAGILSAFAVTLMVSDARGDSMLASAFIWAGAIPMAYAVAEVLWRPRGQAPPVMAAGARTLVLPFLIAPIITIVNLIVVMIPPVNAQIAASAGTREHYYFPDGDSPLFVVSVLGGLGNLIVAMLVGLLVWVLVVIPINAFTKPKEFAKANLLSDAPEDEAANSSASKALAIVIAIAFLSPSLIIFGNDEAQASDVGEVLTSWLQVFSEPGYFYGDLMWFLGIVLIPVGVLAVIYVVARQRPDHERRRAAGVSSWLDRHK